METVTVDPAEVGLGDEHVEPYVATSLLLVGLVATLAVMWRMTRHG